jgi:hypothetical protein
MAEANTDISRLLRRGVKLDQMDIRVGVSQSVLPAFGAKDVEKPRAWRMADGEW